MAAILRTKGPVCTHLAIHKNGPLNVRNVVKSQFLRAAHGLEAANLGFVRKIAQNDVFIKRLPSDEVQLTAALEANMDLCCTYDDYAARFLMTTPACISNNLRLKLVAAGLVRREHFGLTGLKEEANS